MSGIQFNRHRKFGFITPPLDGALYEQVGVDGVSRLYRGNGDRVFVNGEDAKAVLAAEDAMLRAAGREKQPVPDLDLLEHPENAPKRRQPRRKDEGVPKPTGRFAKMGEQKSGANEMMIAWAKGDQVMAFRDLAKIVMDELGKKVTDEVEAALAITEAGLLEQSEVKVI